MTLTGTSLFETIAVAVALVGGLTMPLMLKVLANAARAGVEDALTPRHKHGKIKA